VKRVLIEFYDPSYLENIAALFGAHYDEVKYLYLRDVDAPSSSTRKRLAYFIWQKFKIRAEFISLPIDNMATLLDCFEAITKEEGRYDFDITGGIPAFIAASGIFAASRTEKNIFLFEYEIEKGKLFYCYPNCDCTSGEVQSRVDINLSVPEMISLSGAAFLGNHGPKRFGKDEKMLRLEVERLWQAVRFSIKGWNAFCAFPSPKELPEGRKGKIFELRREKSFEIIAGKLRAAGIITGEKRIAENNKITVQYTLAVPQKAGFLYEKGGNLLEMVSYFAAKESGVFSDICVGVQLDWDGKQGHGNHEPCNELDLIFTYGHIPVFVSCKGTSVEKEYLYEIATMARHFGGKYAQAMLISAVRNRRSIHNRALEMGILLIDDVSNRGISGLTKKLRHYFPPREKA